MKQRSREGYRYAVIFIHGPTDFWFIKGLTDKASEIVLATFRAVIALTKKHSQPIEALLCDRGREFTSEQFDTTCAQEGILRQYSSPHRQDQNGRSERSWRTLEEATVTMLSQSGAPKHFWFDCFRLVTFLHNRQGDPSPFELFFSSLGHLPARKPFGCLALAVKPSILQHKLGSRVRECAMLGYDVHTKGGYVLLDLDSRRVITRLDVIFFDQRFPLNPGCDRGLRAPEPEEELVDVSITHEESAHSCDVTCAVRADFYTARPCATGRRR